MSDTSDMNEQKWAHAMNRYKHEVAKELGLKDKIDSVGWKHMTTEECGRIGGQMGGKLGGQMVKKMIAMAEEQLVNKYKIDPGSANGEYDRDKG